MFHAREDLPCRRAVACELIGDDHPWHIAQALEQLAEERLSSFFVPPGLYENVEDIPLLIHSPPQVMALTIWYIRGSSIRI
jgi:hypothetical protein